VTLGESRAYQMPGPESFVADVRVRRAELAGHLSIQLAGADLHGKAGEDDRHGKPLVKRRGRQPAVRSLPRWPTSPEWQDHASMFGLSLLLFLMSGVLGICRRLPEEPPEAGQAALGLLPPPPLLFLAQLLRKR